MVVAIVMATAHYAELTNLPPGVAKILAYLGAAVLPIAFVLLKDAFTAQNAQVRARLEWGRWEHGHDGRQIVHGWPKVVPQPFPTGKDEQLKVFVHWAMWLHGIMGAEKIRIMALLREGNQAHCSPPLTDDELRSAIDYAVAEERTWSLSDVPFRGEEVWSMPLILLFFGSAMVLSASMILSFVIQFVGAVTGIEALRTFRFL